MYSVGMELQPVCKVLTLARLDKLVLLCFFKLLYLSLIVVEKKLMGSTEKVAATMTKQEPKKIK